VIGKYLHLLVSTLTCGAKEQTLFVAHLAKCYRFTIRATLTGYLDVIRCLFHGFVDIDQFVDEEHGW
jgi:hypothetical protein